ncbi:MAG: hypothetical protein KUG74_15300 [Rhodobacteraceae bacterium]|nr:hypothetical protein [Paracoccaceae bacterium]
MGYPKTKIAEMIGSYPACASCGAKSIVRDAWASWSRMAREWVLKSVFDNLPVTNAEKLVIQSGRSIRNFAPNVSVVLMTKCGSAISRTARLS